MEVKPRSSTASPKTTPFPPTTKDAGVTAVINADSAIDAIADATADNTTDADAATDNDAKAEANADATAKKDELMHDSNDKLTGIHILKYDCLKKFFLGIMNG